MKFFALLASVSLSIVLTKASPFVDPPIPALALAGGLLPSLHPPSAGSGPSKAFPTSQASSDSSNVQDTSDSSDTSDHSDSVDTQDVANNVDAQDATQTSDNPFDKQILQWALFIKQMMSEYYNQFLTNSATSDFTTAGFTANQRGYINQIGQHEAKHVQLLTDLLGPTDSFLPCSTYTFFTGTPTVRNYVDMAILLEGMTAAGFVGAYPKVSNAQNFYQTTMAALAAADARHASFLQNPISSSNSMGFTSPATPNAFPWSNAYETHLTFSEVWSYLQQFASSCATITPTLPFKTFPTLTTAPSGTAYAPGSNIVLTYTNPSATGAYIAVYNGYNVTYSPITSGNMAKLPSNFQGTGYVVVTKQNKDSDSNIVAGPAVITVPINDMSMN